MKKITKKVLAIILSVLMIAASFPLTAFAATDAEATTLKNAITAYENAMDGTVYTDMGSVYTLYLNAVKAYDQYKYGGNTTVDLATPASQLSAATTAMQSRVFDGVDSSITVGQVTTDDSNYDTAEWYKNVLWVETNYSARRSYQEQDYHGIGLYQPGITLLYDGKTAPTGTVLIHGYGRGGTGLFSSSKYRYLLAGFLTNNNLSFNQEWRGIPSNLDINWALWANENQLHAWSAQTSNGVTFSAGKTYAMRNSKTNNNYRFANFYTFSGTMDANTPTLEITPQITCYVNSATAWKTDDGANMTLDGTAIHIVNYKRLIDAARSSSNANKLILGSNYDEGGAASLLSAYDALTSLNIHSYFTSSNDYSGAATAITNAINALNSATATADGTGYANLREAIDNKKATYDAGNIGYTADSWAEFADAYEDAQAIFTDISAYNDNSGAQSAADRLNNAQLVTLVEKVDATDLELAIDEALVAIANSTMFTSASYSSSNIASVVAAAQTAVWGSVDNYKIDANKLDDTSANQAIVAQQLAAVQNAIYALRINTSSAVSSAGGYSLQTAIQEGQGYNPADYANGDALTTAISAGQNFVDNISMISKGAVSAKIQEYIDDVQAIVSAIRNLQPAFSMIANGTIANAGTKESVRVTPKSNRDIYTVLDRNNNIILFRRNGNQEVIVIGEADIEHHTYANFDSHLDAIFLNDTYEEEGEIKSSNLITGNQEDQVLSDSQIQGLRACEGIEYTFSDGTKFYIDNIHVTSTSTDALGRDESGDNIVDTEFDFTDYLTRVWGTNWPPNGAISAKAGSTFATGQMNLLLSAKEEATLSASTVPVNDTYSYTAYFGSLYTWKLQDVWNYAGWSHGRTQYTQTINVIDETNLMRLIEICDALNGNEYTISTWNALSSALTAAKSEMAYGSMTAAAITTESVTRYTNLWNAYQALERCANNQSLKDARDYQSSGKTYDVQGTYQAGKGDWSDATWAAFTTAYEAALGNNGLANKYSDANVRNYNTTEQPTIDGLAQALKDAYDALEANILVDPAVNAFNALKALLEDGDYTYYASDLTAINTALAGLTNGFYAMSIGDITSADNSAALQNEVTVINGLVANLTPVENFDKDAFRNYVAAARAKANDPDAYDVNAVVSAIEALETAAFETVTISNYGDVIGLAADAQQKVDQAEAAALSIPLRTYTVEVKDANGTALTGVGEGTYPYGTSVTINAGTGNYTYDYTSNTSNTNKKHKVKDIGTVDSFTFTVQGDTTITVGAPTDSKPVTVTYKANLAGKGNFVIKTDYVAAGTTITAADFTAPSYAFYSYDGFTQKASDNGDITVTLNYVVVQTGLPQYTIFNMDEDDGETYAGETHYFNELVTLTFEDNPICLVAADYDTMSDYYNNGTENFSGTPLTLMAYGDTYSFRAKENLYVGSVFEEADWDYIKKQNDETGTASPVYVRAFAPNVGDEGAEIYGTFVIPSELNDNNVEAGILIQYNKQEATLLDRELSFNNVNVDEGNDKIRRLKAVDIFKNEDNRFTIKVTNFGDIKKAKYVAYVNYKDASGNIHTVFSDAQTYTAN